MKFQTMVVVLAMALINQAHAQRSGSTNGQSAQEAARAQQNAAASQTAATQQSRLQVAEQALAKLKADGSPALKGIDTKALAFRMTQSADAANLIKNIVKEKSPSESDILILKALVKLEASSLQRSQVNDVMADLQLSRADIKKQFVAMVVGLGAVTRKGDVNKAQATEYLKIIANGGATPGTLKALRDKVEQLTGKKFTEEEVLAALQDCMKFFKVG